ncbi:hypothetical protein PMAYCL1PPCAC_04676 [Pristionchus mayeri]|uniref:Peptidase n=1 Tax=Pristionchus mayeri TaxID=1317129 RepID=A0AAN4Z8P3_9BILA|nr:hypothetical protein PMAYCL1PPCAC_04676 [Pristionchus mayeri]
MLPFHALLLFGFAYSAPLLDHPHRVVNLPGAPEPHSPLYSGFLTVDENETQQNVFYVLAEAVRIDPSEAPLIVWFNGGPGTSSLSMDLTYSILLDSFAIIISRGISTPTCCIWRVRQGLDSHIQPMIRKVSLRTTRQRY